MSRSKLSSQIEAILLVANRSVNVKELSSALNIKPEEIETVLGELAEYYDFQNSGIKLIKAASNYQLVSAGEHADILKKFLKTEVNAELSQPSLEALTIIAYRGPLTKLELERIRGVNCSLIIRNLLLRGLIEENFNKQKNETYYQVTLDFVRFLNFKSIEELPDYEKLHQADELEEILMTAEEL